MQNVVTVKMSVTEIRIFQIRPKNFFSAQVPLLRKAMILNFIVHDGYL